MCTIGRVVSRVGLSRSEINHTTYRTQVELVCPDLRSTTRPIVHKSSWFIPICRTNLLNLGTIGRVVDLRSGQNQIDLGTIGLVVDLRSGQNQLNLGTIGRVVDLKSGKNLLDWLR
jgi:hypothetical protein